MYVLLLFLAVYIFKIQLTDGAYYRQRSERNRIRLVPVKATRGRILDRHNIPLASTLPSFDVLAIPEDFSRSSAEHLAPFIGMSADEIMERVRRRSEPSFVPVVIKRDLTEAEVHTIEEHNHDLPGVRLTVVGKRAYPYGMVAAHVIGYLGKISLEEFTTRKYLGYLLDDDVGKAGIEAVFEDVLRGTHGGKQIEVNARGEETGVIARRAPAAGGDITLSVDVELERTIYENIKGETASVCMMDITTGELLVLLSNPAFDPNAFVTPSRSAERIQLMQDPAQPFLSRPTSSRYPPGSIFKVLIALAALEEGKIRPRSTFYCAGDLYLSLGSRPFRCWSLLGHKRVNLIAALQQSCNVYFYRLGLVLGAEAIARFGERIELGAPVRLEIPQAQRSVVPSPHWKWKALSQEWYPGDTVNYAIGQGYLALTPLQIMRLVAIVAGNGTMIEPTLVKGVRHKPKDYHIAPDHIAAVKEGMLKVVNTPAGTGKLARVDFFKIAAKTGTAQCTGGESHSWFAGFFPYENPRIVLVTMVEHGGRGGGKAALIAKQAATAWYERYRDTL